MIHTIENMNEFYKNIRIDFIHQAISIPGVAMQQNFIFLIPRIKIFIICLKRTLLVDLVSFSIDTMNLVKHLFEIIQTNHVRKSLVMMQMLFIFGPYLVLPCSRISSF